MIRPAATQSVPYIYDFTADTTGNGSYGAGAGNNPATYSNNNYLQSRWNWDNTGTFASAIITTAYNDSSHNSPTVRGGGAILAGHATDTGATARSYLKANFFGRVDSGGAPAAAPTNAPVVTDGSTGAATPSAGANFLTNYQGLMADVDWILAPFTPAAVTADKWTGQICLFTGPNQTPAVNIPLCTLRYTWT